MSREGAPELAETGIDAGDRTIVLGRGQALAVAREAGPLGSFKGAYRRFDAAS